MHSKSTTAVLMFLAVCAFVLILAIMLWLPGNWRWWEGWIFAVWMVAFFSVYVLWLYLKDPALLKERFRRPGTGGESRSDLAILIGIKVGGLSWFLLPALDVRFGWTPRLPLWSEVCGGLILVAGSFFMLRAFTDNTFASQMVRIQTERGQHVVDTGVYGFVRHPMYLGAVLLFVGGSLLRGTLGGLLLGVALSLLLVVRIFGEEKLLTHDLAGYEQYIQKVRYRLLPHVW